MLRTRILTALVAAPIGLLAAWKGGWLFTGVIGILAVFGWREFFKLLPLPSKPNLLQYMGGTFSLLMVLAAQDTMYMPPFEVFIALAFLLMMGTIFILRDPQQIPIILYSFVGVGYLGLGFSLFVKVRAWEFPDMLNGGLIILGIVVVATWMNDSFAYFAGSIFGRRKLCAPISPAKSWEGAIVGMIAAATTVAGAGKYFDLPFSIGALAFLGLIVGACGILGDLGESGLKRWAGIKDSGNFFPGHGGVLDRLDSLLFVVPATYIWLWVMALVSFFSI